MRRGEIWTAAAGGGDTGKQRAVVIVRDDRFDATASITMATTGILKVCRICSVRSSSSTRRCLRTSVRAIDRDGVRPMRRDPRIADHAAGSPIREAQEAFNRTYCALLGMLDRAFNGGRQTLGEAVGVMYGLKSQAQALMQIPTEDGLATAGPTFECVSPEDRR